MRADGHDAVGLGGGAPIAQRAGGAEAGEDGAALVVESCRGGEDHGVAVGAGDRAGVGVDGEVVQGESAGDGGGQRGWFDQQPVPGGGQVGAQGGGGVGGVGQELQGAAFGDEQGG